MNRVKLVKRSLIITVIIGIGLIGGINSTRALVADGFNKIAASVGLSGDSPTTPAASPATANVNTTTPAVSSKPNNSVVTNQPGSNPNKEKQPILIVDLTVAGFEPEEMTVRPGSKVLVIRNRSGLDNQTFTVTHPGKSPDRVLTKLGEDFYSSKVPFTPGDVVITSVDEPSLTCRIHVEP